MIFCQSDWSDLIVEHKLRLHLKCNLKPWEENQVAVVVVGGDGVIYVLEQVAKVNLKIWLDIVWLIFD